MLHITFYTVTLLCIFLIFSTLTFVFLWLDISYKRKTQNLHNIHQFPITLLIIGTTIGTFLSFTAIPLLSSHYSVSLVGLFFIIYLIFSSIPILIAYSRDIKNVKGIYYLSFISSCLGISIILCIISMLFVLFNKKTSTTEKHIKKYDKFYTIFAILTPAFLIFVGIINHTLIYTQNSSSMLPSSHPQTNIFISKNLDSLNVGDIVVFRNPTNESVDYVKRLIGKPGDTIQMIDGRLNINGKQVIRNNARPYIIARLPKNLRGIGYYKDNLSIKGNKLLVDNKPATFNYTIEYESNCVLDDGHCGIYKMTEYDEVLPNGVKHSIIELSDNNGFADNTPLYKVPENAYFFMGDNRDFSFDSRWGKEHNGIGYVPRDNILGKVWFVF